MAGLQDLIEAYRNYRGTQEWKLGKQEEQMLGGDPQAMGLWEKLQGFGPADMGGIAGAIKAYHGSPNPTPFTKFHKDFIGAGEGTQYQGYGHYLAERPGTSKYYTEMDGPMFKTPQYNAVLTAAMQSSAKGAKNPEYGLTSFLNKLTKEMATRQRWLDKALKYPNVGGNPSNIKNWQRQISSYQDKIDTINELLSDKNLFDNIFNNIGDVVMEPNYNKPLRSIYEVSMEWPGARESIDPMSREHFYQWDKKFADQPEHVKQALLDVHKSDPKKFPNIGSSAVTSTLQRGSKKIPRGTLEQMLYERGIPGVAYLDAFSRNNPSNPTYNYVAFGDEIPRILSHNKPSVLDMLWPKK